MSNRSVAIPGDVVGGDEIAGFGTGVYVNGSQLCASIFGPIVSTSSTKRNCKGKNVSISRTNGSLLPEVGTVVLGKVTRTNPRQANVSILVLGSSGEHVCHDAFPAIIRQQDIRSTEIDKVKVSESFRVGDVVRAAVISLGDERSYYLSTAKNELGVVMATSEWGNQMYPISWKEFQDPVTGLKELRNVAKPV